MFHAHIMFHAHCKSQAAVTATCMHTPNKGTTCTFENELNLVDFALVLVCFARVCSKHMVLKIFEEQLRILNTHTWPGVLQAPFTRGASGKCRPIGGVQSHSFHGCTASFCDVRVASDKISPVFSDVLEQQRWGVCGLECKGYRHKLIHENDSHICPWRFQRGRYTVRLRQGTCSLHCSTWCWEGTTWWRPSTRGRRLFFSDVDAFRRIHGFNGFRCVNFAAARYCSTFGVDFGPDSMPRHLRVSTNCVDQCALIFVM